MEKTLNQWYEYLIRQDFKSHFVTYRFAQNSNPKSKSILYVFADLGKSCEISYQLEEELNTILIHISEFPGFEFHLLPNTPAALKEKTEITPAYLRAAMSDFQVLLTDQLLVLRET